MILRDFLFAGDGGGVLFGATLGAGFSNDLNKWAIRFSDDDAQAVS